MALWKAMPRFRGESSERTYVYRIAHNTAISFVTSRERKAGREETEDGIKTQPARVPSPEQEAIASQRRQRLWNAVQELSLIDRQIVLLYLEGLPTAEIEEVTGFTAGKVAMRLFRIRRWLAERLNQDEAGESQ